MPGGAPYYPQHTSDLEINKLVDKVRYEEGLSGSNSPQAHETANNACGELHRRIRALVQQRDSSIGNQSDAAHKLLQELHKVAWFEVCDWESLSEKRFEVIRAKLEELCPDLQGKEYSYTDVG
ncbi:MAG: hypothetical protein WDZ82_01655 [Candidatus Paceibacterota bacterium]